MNVIMTGGVPIEGFQGTVIIGSDMQGKHLKELIEDYFNESHVKYLNAGIRDDVADITQKVAAKVLDGTCTCGILITDLGHDACMAANKIPFVCCTSGDKPTRAVLGRQENDSNMLAIGCTLTGFGVAMETVWKFLTTGFLGGEFARRKNQVEIFDEPYVTGGRGLFGPDDAPPQ